MGNIDFTDTSIMLHQALPSFTCADVPKAVAWYRDVLGFRVTWSDGHGAVLDRDRITLLVGERKPGGIQASRSYLYIRDANLWHAELTRRGVTIDGPPVDHPWGLRDFTATDLDGNQLTFGQPLW